MGGPHFAYFQMIYVCTFNCIVNFNILKPTNENKSLANLMINKNNLDEVTFAFKDLS